MTLANTTQQALTGEPLRGLPSTETWNTIREVGTALVASGLVPVKTPEAAVAIILKGAELGAPPMQAFSHISVIQGKPTCSSEFQLSLLGRGGCTWSWIKDGSDGEAVIQFQRPGFGKAIGRFSMDDAKRAGLAGKDNWKKWPRNMLRARAVSDGARQIGPDLLAGMSYTPEELGAPTDEDGMAVSTVFTVDEPAADAPAEPPLQTAVQPDAEADEVAALWSRVGELKALLPEDAVKRELQPFGVVLGTTKRSEVTPDALRSIVEALENEVAVQWDELIEGIVDLESRVHNAPTHTTNARNKHVGSDDPEAWTRDEHGEALWAYRNHLQQQMNDAAETEA